MRVNPLAAFAASAVLSGCGSLAMQDDAPARIEAALKAYSARTRALDADGQVEAYELRGVTLQLVGPSALQTGTFRQKARLADGRIAETNGTFEAEWERQPDGSWLLARMTINPPPLEAPKVGEIP